MAIDVGDLKAPLPLSPEIKQNWHVSVVNGTGSLDRFHHFLLGFFIPIVYQLSTSWAKAKFNNLIVRSCGPLDSLMREFGHDRIEIIDKDQHRQMAEAAVHGDPACADMSLGENVKLRFVTIHGCDYPETYDKRKFEKARDVLQSIVAIRSEIHALMDHWPREGARILLIQRGSSLAFYHSEQSVLKGSGRDRRSIANHEELHQSLRRDHAGCLNVLTENLTLARQFALFSLADIIVAQHGAALANIVWARPSATVIEITPKRLGVREEEFREFPDFFLHLSRCVGLRHRRVWQDHQFGDVDINQIRSVVAEIIAAPEHPAIPRFRSAAFRIYQPVIPIGRAVRSYIRRGLGKALRLARNLGSVFRL
jgi:Glycosyltransferase 61